MHCPVSVVADLERYRLISKIGSGGMATVDLAEDTLLGRRVALKRIEGTVDVSGLSRLRREALAGASLNHPNLVSVYDILTLENGHLVIVMEYVQGETLRELLTRRGALPPAEALPLLAGVAAGLDAIHGAGIVHRDVKPSNILLGEAGVVKVADLGVASVPDRTGLTTSGSIIGSLNYMAPEQLDTGPVTPAIDVYAFAAMAFEVLSGAKARNAANPVALAHAIATKPPPSLSEAWPAAPRAATDLLTRGMSRRPQDRPASAGQLVAELERGLDVRTERATITSLGGARQRRAPGGARQHRAPAGPRERRPPAGPPEPRAPREHSARSRRGILAAAALGLACVAAALVVILNQTSSPPPRTAASGATRPSPSAPRHPASTSQRSRSQSASQTATATSSATAPATSSATAPAAAGPTAPAAAGATAPPSSSTPASGSTATAAPGSDASPTAAVESFYRLAAARRYPEAWALADPAFRAQLGGYQSFVAGQANDRSITFDGAQVTSQTGNAATVTLHTTSVQSDGTRHCRGSVDLVSSTAGHWLVHQIDIHCT
jgi:serine/threonine-protein kinase